MLVSNNTIQDNIKISLPKIKESGISSRDSEVKKPYLSNLSLENHHAYALTFLGNEPPVKKFDDQVKSVEKNYQGQGLFVGEYIDWDKVGWDKLKKEPIDWKSANEDEIAAFWHALALAEAKENIWVKRYNPTNVPNMLATYHTLASHQSKVNFQLALDELNTITENKDSKFPKPPFLDQPVINPETGELNIEFTVFDTETTGVNTNPRIEPLDTIVQIGAVKVASGGKIKPETILNQLVNPEVDIPEAATNVHGITNKDVEDKPTINEILRNFRNNYLKDDLLVAYNAKFDTAMLNNAIDNYNKISSKELKKEKLCMVLDPFVLIQRIHPYLGAKKTLNEQHKFVFGQDIEGAHDALKDTNATVNLLKYCCYYLNKHYKPDNAGNPLTVKDILTFQMGGKVDGLDIKLDTSGCDSSKSFKRSYRLITVGVENFPDGFLITEPTKRSMYKRNVITPLEPEIGPDNVEILRKRMLDEEYKVFANFKVALEESGIHGYNDKTRDEIINIIADKSIQYRNKEYISIWMKNAKPGDKQIGNDLPDVGIIKKVMAEQEKNQPEQNASGRELSEMLKNQN